MQEPDRFLSSLLALGKKGPRHVLCPSSDDFAYLLGLHAEKLQEHFHFCHPGFWPIVELLDKRRLHENCTKVGIQTPITFYPETAAEVAQLARTLDGPLVVKPRLQVLSSHSKGAVTDRTGLADAYDALLRRNRYGRAVLDHCPEATRPMVQRFHTGGTDGIYSIAGFVDPTFSHWAMRASLKVLQRPRRLGIGLCFESAPLNPDLATRLLELFRRIGYYGVFEVEFLREGGEHILIDANPRLYSQVAFDVARGLPLPLMMYHAALDDRRRLIELIEAANRPESGARAYVNRFALEMTLLMRLVAGQSSREEVRVWHAWCRLHQHDGVDAAFDLRDPVPGLLDALQQLRTVVRHPGGFLRHAVWDK